MSGETENNAVANSGQTLETRVEKLEQALGQLTGAVTGHVGQLTAALQSANFAVTGGSRRSGVTPRGVTPTGNVPVRKGDPNVEYGLLEDRKTESAGGKSALPATAPLGNDPKILAAEIARRFGAELGVTAKVGLAQQQKNGPVMWRVSFLLQDTKLETIPGALRGLGFVTENGVSNDEREAIKFATSSDKSELRTYVPLELMSKALKIPQPKTEGLARG